MAASQPAAGLSTPRLPLRSAAAGGASSRKAPSTIACSAHRCAMSAERQFDKRQAAWYTVSGQTTDHLTISFLVAIQASGVTDDAEAH